MTKKSIGKKHIAIILVLFLTVFMVGCNLVQVNPERDAQQVIAEIGEETITKGDFNYHFAVEELAARLQGQQMPGDEEILSQIKSDVLDLAVHANLIVQLAKQEGVEVNGENIEEQVQEFQDYLKETIGEENYNEVLENNRITDEGFYQHIKNIFIEEEYVLGLQEIILGDIEVSQEEAQEFYEENEKRFDPSTVEAKHILATTEELAQEIAEKAKDGMDFNELMEEYRGQEGILEASNLGEFTYGKMVPEFSDAAFALEPGEVSDPVQSSFGFHVIKVEDKTKQDIQTFEEVKEEIEGELLLSKRNIEYQNYINEKTEELGIEIQTYPEKL